MSSGPQWSKRSKVGLMIFESTTIPCLGNGLLCALRSLTGRLPDLLGNVKSRSAAKHPLPQHIQYLAGCRKRAQLRKLFSKQSRGPEILVILRDPKKVQCFWISGTLETFPSQHLLHQLHKTPPAARPDTPEPRAEKIEPGSRKSCGHESRAYI